MTIALATLFAALGIWNQAPEALSTPAPVGSEVSVTADPFDQRNFPCAEDEVLGYAPEFGPDRVGCIHIDQLR
ncbi:hypothetical protein KIP30_gp10 [Mycobacterium phage Pistachio]|uniref:Uncharacterized protein n=1 Tax=Mycobacterium phage Pistachio TaxID=2126722 RepID=A0A2R4A2D0_9CAUD|nr:hypothetical protein KIP30_gp10 [Mycobacterium phage Pistachio]AVR57070.1 hypothetical protein PBI_PUPPY_88 [Mycobacterium phage Puppy]AVR57159.1 hypothetical protein PBI_PISTACHIO_87 [Mycobacterium phage Pistachio]AVR77498.1 hypothetical protein SEA_TNGUYEN7_88 [Mycobacterium phage TNguyen7]WAB10272.1 hypothetical protein PBI_BLUEBIRD_89 [Mycobacterium phage BlueBird]